MSSTYQSVAIARGSLENSEAGHVDTIGSVNQGLKRAGCQF